MSTHSTYEEQYNTWFQFYADRWSGAAVRRLELAEEDVVGVLRHYKDGEPSRAKLDAELAAIRLHLGVKF